MEVDKDKDGEKMEDISEPTPSNDEDEPEEVVRMISQRERCIPYLH